MICKSLLPEIVFRSFSEILQKVGKKKSYARGAKVENMLKFLKFSKDSKKKTLSIVQLKRISFSNFGFKKNKIEGEIFEKKFKAYLDKDING